MRILALPIAPLAALPFATGCDFGTLDDLSQDKAVQASSEVTQTASSFWAKYDSASDADVKGLRANIDGVIERTGQIPIQVKIDGLTVQDLTNIHFEMKDPSLAQG